MSLDPRFICSLDLSPYLVNKRTGLPIMNGEIQFWVDTQRNTPKLVYTITGEAPNYSFVPLPNPVRVVNGTTVDNNGDNVVVYYFPYDSFSDDAAVQLYYIVVTEVNAFGYDEEQLTRVAWPNISATSPEPVTAENSFANLLSNSQFVDINFQPMSRLMPVSTPFNASPSFTISFSGSGNVQQNIGSDWIIKFSYTGSGSLQITRNAISGNSVGLPGNAPYSLTITPSGSNITPGTLMLYQTLANNPDIWSPDASLSNGYVSTSISTTQGTILNVNYAPSTGTLQELLTSNNQSGGWFEYTNVIQLIAPDNSSAPPAGYVQIQLVLSSTLPSTFTNVQIVPLEQNIADVPYQQQPVNYQIDHTFHSYRDEILYKPTPSYLTGWNFPYNPAQFAGSSVGAIASGAATSNYYWDQTIIFQSANSGVSVSRSGSGSLVVTASATTQFALVQYVPVPVASDILNNFFSINVAATTNQTAGIPCTASVWYTSSTLPSISGSNQSIVASLDSNGNVLTQNGSWTIVPVTEGNPTFTVQVPISSFPNLAIDYGLSCWGIQSGTIPATTTYVAVVIGFGSLTSGNVVTIDSISLVEGLVPTRPAPRSKAVELLDCQQYYVKSFAPATVPAQAIGQGTGEYQYVPVENGVADDWSPTVYFPAIMNTVPSITLYNPVNANAQVYNVNQSTDMTNSNANNIVQKGFNVHCKGISGTLGGSQFIVHWTADARLGK